MPQDRTPAEIRAEANSEETKQLVRRVRRVTRRKFSPQEKAAVIALVRGSPPDPEHRYSVERESKESVRRETGLSDEYHSEGSHRFQCRLMPGAQSCIILTWE